MANEHAYQKAFEYKVIYAFVINDVKHRGMIKVGDTTLKTNKPIDQLSPNSKDLNQAAIKRIREYTRTAGVSFSLKHTELAVRMVKDENGNQALKAFRDHDVHRVLVNSGFEKKTISNTTGREWFEADVEMVKKAIQAVKNSAANLSGTNSTVKVPIIFRPEQEAAMEKTIKQFKNGNSMLWNAKMRFGKTVCALEIVRRMGFGKSIIITHRPVVDAGWYEDFNNIFTSADNTIYGSKAKGSTLKNLEESGKKYIYFASIQDLRGSSEVSGKFDKNQEVFKTRWDCVIIDEAHEGTTTELGKAVKEALIKYHPKLLELSGTPFNIMDQYDEASTYTWDYVMEQENKYQWNKTYFGDANPYDELPELKIYTYDLGDLMAESDFITFEDKAFNFTEFFRTWTSDYSIDHAQMPERAKVGDFVHEGDIWNFLNLMTSADAHSAYPFSTEEYRDLFRHSLWMVPGIKEAHALKKLMLQHPVFGNGCFEIVNVAGYGDEEEKSRDALEKVKKAIKDAGAHNYTITLSCGKLTTGVTVREWTAVFMLSGSYSTSAANYLQTIFRVQSPCNRDGKIKETGYVFDFAPDRTLKMVAAASRISGKLGKDPDTTSLGKFLNYCPVIAISGSEMKKYDTNKLLQQIKRVYADRVVRSGFDDTSLYNDELLKLSDIDIQKFDDLKGIIGKSKAAPKANDITVNDQGLTNEEYEEKEKLEKKKKKREALTPEEKARLEELKKKKKVRNDAISILRGISIRMPLLIYGADIPLDEDVTIDKFTDLIDDASWEEFMPKGVTKEKFKEFIKYYDAEIFVAAGRRIRNIAKRADEMEPTKRVQEIASLFSYFKNPDKETVLTPWRVVNMHMSDCIGGWDFWDEAHKEVIDAPRFVDQGDVTADVFGKKDTRILEINSKTGLYPLYVTYSVYRNKCAAFTEEALTPDKKTELWDEAVRENVFVICKTPMAKHITQRTLMGFRKGKINAHYFDDLINTLVHKPKLFIEKVTKESYWKKGNGIMKFDAIVGNPPYQVMDGGNGASAKPVYNLFVSTAKQLKPDYLSMITPSRWFTGGKGLDDFRKEMLTDCHHRKLIDYENFRDVFPGVDVAGGVSYFLWDRNHNGLCEVTNVTDKVQSSEARNLGEFDIFIRQNRALSVIHKVLIWNTSGKTLSEVVSPRKPFGLPTNYSPKETGVPCYFIQKIGKKFADSKDIEDPKGYLDKWKFLAPSTPIAGQTDFSKPIKFYYDSNTRIAKPGECCTESYLVLGAFRSEEEVISFRSYVFTKLVRFLLLQTVVSQHVNRGQFIFIPDLGTYKGRYSDEMLCKMWNITEEEWQYIETKIDDTE